MSHVSNNEEQSSAALETPDKVDGPKGISGWLVLPLIGFVGTIIMTMNNLSQVGGAELNLLLTSDVPMIVALRTPTLASLISGVIVVIAALACVILLSRQSRRLPAAAITFYCLLLAASLIEFWVDTRISDITGAARDPDISKELARSAIIAAVWIPYFLKSKRVRNTFTR